MGGGLVLWGGRPRWMKRVPDILSKRRPLARTALAHDGTRRVDTDVSGRSQSLPRAASAEGGTG